MSIATQLPEQQIEIETHVEICAEKNGLHPDGRVRHYFVSTGNGFRCIDCDTLRTVHGKPVPHLTPVL